jgi:signal peptidase I
MTSQPYSARVLGSVIEQALDSRHLVRFRAEGASMRPTIRSGESIVVAAVAESEVVAGDILLYRRAARLLAHRVVCVTSDGGRRRFELRGDAKRASDAPVVFDAVIGRVVGVVRNGRLVPLRGRGARIARALGVLASRPRTHAAAVGAVVHAAARRLSHRVFGDSVYHPIPAAIDRRDPLPARPAEER